MNPIDTMTKCACKSSDDRIDWEDIFFGVALFVAYQLITNWHDNYKCECKINKKGEP